MTDFVVETRDLTRRYARVVAVDRLTMLGAPPGPPPVLSRTGALVEEPRSTRSCPAGTTCGCWPGTRTHRCGESPPQRLGVAAALVKDPDLLIPDEPTNGLDPAMAETRELVRSLGRQGPRCCCRAT